MFEGTGTALITPFNDQGVDYQSLELLLDNQINNNIDALFICGTTGEPATMTTQERNQVIDFCIKYINHRVPTFIGTGCNCTAQAVENSIMAEKMGADGLLVVTPYYNKCTQQGLFLHYKAISDSVNIPIFAYNVPGRTGVNLLTETALRLTELKNIRAIKEACGNLEQIGNTINAVKGSQISIYSGDDSLAVDIIKMGGKGLISVASNLIPSVMRDLTHFALEGNIEQAQSLNTKYHDLLKALFLEVNPIPIKHACSMVGLCKDQLRLPLTTMSASQAEKLDAVMRNLNLIK